MAPAVRAGVAQSESGPGIERPHVTRGMSAKPDPFAAAPIQMKAWPDFSAAMNKSLEAIGRVRRSTT